MADQSHSLFRLGHAPPRTIERSVEPGRARQLPLSVGPPIDQIKFSPDGKYILAQAPNKVYVLSRDPFRYLFEVDDLQTAANWHDAQFTPDSQSLVFVTANLRVERWDIASQKQMDVREVVIQRGWCTRLAIG